MNDGPCLAAQNIYYLEQGARLLGGLDAEIYTRESNGPRSGGVGGQFRHLIDYYECFLRDLAGGRIDYDRRRRCPELETDPQRAVEQIRRLAGSLGELGAGESQRVLWVKADHFGPGTTPAAEPFSRSSVERELLFLLSHTVHHFALIALMLRGQDVAVPDQFGVAPSTQEHWSRSAECAR